MENKYLKKEYAKLLWSYTDGSSVSVMCDKLSVIDEFLIKGFNSEDELYNYFSKMPKKNINGQLDSGEFKLIYFNGENYKDLKLLFRNDLEQTQNTLQEGLFDDEDLVKKMLNNCPELFPRGFYDRMLVSFDGKVPKNIYYRNVRTLLNNLLSGNLSRNFRSIYNTVNEYTSEKAKTGEIQKLKRIDE